MRSPARRLERDSAGRSRSSLRPRRPGPSDPGPRLVHCDGLTRPQPGSRAVTDELLRDLRAARWRPGGWWRLLGRSLVLSAADVRTHADAAVEVTALHAVAVAVASPGRRRWPVLSWALSITHLGLLGPRSSLGTASWTSLLRANLPAVPVASCRWLSLAAVVTDVADGQLARRRPQATVFGFYADPLADAAFWIWLTRRYEPNRAVRVVTVAVWALPAGVLALSSLRRGSMVDIPRLLVLRPAAVWMVLLAVRAWRNPPSRHGDRVP